MTDTTKRYQGIDRLVIKVGTGYLFDKHSNGSGYVFRGDQLDGLTEELAYLSPEKEIIIVSSGAIATAACKLNLSQIPEDPYKKAQLAGIGQPFLSIQYQERFARYGKQCAQCLITRDDIDIRIRRRNLRKNQEGYFNDGVITVYNENDFISLDEIRFGDNDILAALLSDTMDADLLVMLSHPTEGLGTGGGKSKEEARKIVTARNIPIEILNDRYELESGIFKPKIRCLV